MIEHKMIAYNTQLACHNEWSEKTVDVRRGCVVRSAACRDASPGESEL